jgi:amino-acid N-acetyltransferase
MAVAFGPAPSTAAFADLLAANGLPIADLAEVAVSDCVVATIDGRVIGAVALQIAGRDALLRSLVVAAGQRGQRIGEQLVQRIESVAQQRGVSTLYLLTNTAEAFFARRGYTATERENAPASIRSLREFASLCPASASFLRKLLN